MVIYMLSENKKIIITAITVTIFVLVTMIAFDSTLDMWKGPDGNDNTTTPQATTIVVSGDGSSGTGNVQNVKVERPVKYVKGTSKTVVQQVNKEEVNTQDTTIQDIPKVPNMGFAK